MHSCQTWSANLHCTPGTHSRWAFEVLSCSVFLQCFSWGVHSLSVFQDSGTTKMKFFSDMERICFTPLHKLNLIICRFAHFLNEINFTNLQFHCPDFCDLTQNDSKNNNVRLSKKYKPNIVYLLEAKIHYAEIIFNFYPQSCFDFEYNIHPIYHQLSDQCIREWLCTHDKRYPYSKSRWLTSITNL